MTKDRVLGVILVLFIGIMYAQTFKFEEKAAWQVFSSALYPRVLLLLIAIPTIILLFKSFQPIRQKDDQQAEKTSFWPKYGTIILQFAFFGIYVYLLSLIGFIVATIIYLFASQANLMGIKKTKMILLNSSVSVVTPIVVYFVFTHFLKVWLP